MFLYIIGIKSNSIMFIDGIYRPISYHDTWISIDPIEGCLHNCVYCVLKHVGSTNTRPIIMLSVSECINRLLEYSLFTFGNIPIAIGNETDMFDNKNITYLIELLNKIKQNDIPNPIVLISKSLLTCETLDEIKRIKNNKIIFFISYSGLGEKYEPGFNEKRIKQSFEVIKSYNFPIIHFWRPLISRINTKRKSIRDILAFVSDVSDASVFTGMKLHPKLNLIMLEEHFIRIPKKIQKKSGEWLSMNIIQNIYKEAKNICPTYPLFRHTSCAIASVLGIPNHTATLYRPDICPISQCTKTQRNICQSAKVIPNRDRIADTLNRLGRNINYEYRPNMLYFDDSIYQEEFAFILHQLNYPLKVKKLIQQNIYKGDIYKDQKTE
jgi:DNA repair photolyase